MTEICLEHNGIKGIEEVWVFPQYDVAERVRKEQRPVTLGTCSKCIAKVERIRKFIAGEYNGIQKEEEKKK